MLKKNKYTIGHINHIKRYNNLIMITIIIMQSNIFLLKKKVSFRKSPFNQSITSLIFIF
eukprot:UN02310